MTRMEVRCCCKPQKLLGWLPVPRDLSAGEDVRFVIPPMRIKVGRIDDWIEQYRVEPSRVVVLPVALFRGIVQPGLFGEHLALKSEETPLETLRLMPGFIEKGRE